MKTNASKALENSSSKLFPSLSKFFFFYSPTDAQVNCLKNNFRIYIKINIKTEVGFQTVQRAHINKDPIIYAATSPHTDVF